MVFHHNLWNKWESIMPHKPDTEQTTNQPTKPTVRGLLQIQKDCYICLVLPEALYRWLVILTFPYGKTAEWS